MNAGTVRGRLDALCTRANAVLLVELVRAALRSAEHRSILGIFWSVLGPASMLITLYAIFHTKFGGDLPAYPLYLMLGIVPVGSFTSVTRSLMPLFIAQRHMVLSTTVPREILLLSQAALPLWNFVVQMLLCIGLSAAYDRLTFAGLLATVPLTLAFVALTVGGGLLGALAFAFARDAEHIWSVITRLLLLATPVFYSLDNLTPVTRAIVYWGNPMTPFVVALRGVLLQPEAQGGLAYAHAIALGAIGLCLSYAAFTRLEQRAVEQA